MVRHTRTGSTLRPPSHRTPTRPHTSSTTPEITPPVPSDPPGVHPDTDPIASKWQRLASTDQQSPDFLPLLLSLTRGTGHSSTTRLRGDDAEITLGALDQVLLAHFLWRGNSEVVTYIILSSSFLVAVKSQTNVNVKPSV